MRAGRARPGPIVTVARGASRDRIDGAGFTASRRVPDAEVRRFAGRPWPVRQGADEDGEWLVPADLVGPVDQAVGCSLADLHAERWCPATAVELRV